MSEVENNAAEQTAESSTRAQANGIVNKYMGWSVGAGIVPFPVWDVLAIGTVQTMMLKDLYAVYGLSISEKKARSLISVLIGALSPGMLVGITARSFAKFIPVVGQSLSALSSPITTMAITYAIGRLMTSHLEAGGTVETLNVEKAKQELKETIEDAKEVVKKTTGRKPKAKAETTATDDAAPAAG